MSHEICKRIHSWICQVGFIDCLAVSSHLGLGNLNKQLQKNRYLLIVQMYRVNRDSTKLIQRTQKVLQFHLISATFLARIVLHTLNKCLYDFFFISENIDVIYNLQFIKPCLVQKQRRIFDSFARIAQGVYFMYAKHSVLWLQLTQLMSHGSDIFKVAPQNERELGKRQTDQVKKQIRPIEM